MKKFLEVWEDAANSVGGGGVSMPSDAVHDKKKKKVPIEPKCLWTTVRLTLNI